MMYTKALRKKAKSYEDGILCVSQRRYVLTTTEGKTVTEKLVGQTKASSQSLPVDNSPAFAMCAVAAWPVASGWLFVTPLCQPPLAVC